ncbi:MAG: hypothetical protein VCF25_26135 [Candidatus Poribacteria bacterium]
MDNEKDDQIDPYVLSVAIVTVSFSVGSTARRSTRPKGIFYQRDKVN